MSLFTVDQFPHVTNSSMQTVSMSIISKKWKECGTRHVLMYYQTFCLFILIPELIHHYGQNSMSDRYDVTMHVIVRNTFSKTFLCTVNTYGILSMFAFPVCIMQVQVLYKRDTHLNTFYERPNRVSHQSNLQ